MVARAVPRRVKLPASVKRILCFGQVMAVLHEAPARLLESVGSLGIGVVTQTTLPNTPRGPGYKSSSDSSAPT